MISSVPPVWKRWLPSISLSHFQIVENKELAVMMNMDESSSESLEQDKMRYDTALNVLRDRTSTIFSLVLLPERLPVEETASAINGLSRLGIDVQALIINQCILPEVIQGNSFLASRAKLQRKYLDEIDVRFATLLKTNLPLLEHDVSGVGITPDW